MTCQTNNILIKKGKTFRRVLRWEVAPIVYKPITAIDQVAPVRITATGHGLPDGWRATVESVKGMTEINAKSNPPSQSDFHSVTVIDPNTVEFNDVNAAEFCAYRSGGYLRYNTPADMAGFTAELVIKAFHGGDTLLELSTSNGGITIDNTAKTITLVIDAADSTDIEFDSGIYELEMISGSGEVTSLLTGNVTIQQEIAN
jgi:hypothetical protein